MGELATGDAIWVYCQVGQRAYYATRALRLNGYDAYNLSGGSSTSVSRMYCMSMSYGM